MTPASDRQTGRKHPPGPWTVLIVVLSLVAAACASGSGETLTINGVELTEAEFYYGTNVEAHPDVTYQPDVILVPNGAQAVRGVTPDGLTWRLDARAEGVDDLTPGTVMFLTSRGVGRVEAIEDGDGDIRVTISPVDLTDIFSDAEFQGDFEIDVEDVIFDDSGAQAWTVAELPPTEEPEEAEAPEGPEGSQAQGRLISTQTEAAVSEEWLEGDEGDGPVGDPDTNPFLEELVQRREQIRKPSWKSARPVSAAGFGLVPMDGAIGVRWSYTADKKVINGAMRAMAGTPRASFHVKIAGGKIERAEMRVDGNFSLGYEFELGSEAGIPGNLNRRVELPQPIRVPLPPIAGVSLNFTVNQSFLVRTAVSAKIAWLKAAGVYDLSGGFGFGYAGGVNPHGPTGGAIKTSLLNTIRSQSPGVTGMVLGYKATFRVGLGWDVFSVGPFVDLVSSIGVVTGSDLAHPLPVCSLAFLNVWVGAGLSYRLPEIVVDIFNFVLAPITGKRLSAEGNIARIDKELISRNAHYPASKLCDPATA